MVSKHFKKSCFSQGSTNAVLLFCLPTHVRSITPQILHFEAGPEAEQCQKLIEAHKACLRKQGFKV